MALGCLLAQLLQIWVILVFARIVLSWFPISPQSPVSSVYSVLYTVTEPVMGPVRNVIPSVGMLDLSPIVVIIGAQVVSGILC